MESVEGFARNLETGSTKEVVRAASADSVDGTALKSRFALK